MKITTIGLDLAKRVFQVHGVDATGQVQSTRLGRYDSLCFLSLGAGMRRREFRGLGCWRCGGSVAAGDIVARGARARYRLLIRQGHLL